MEKIKKESWSAQAIVDQAPYEQWDKNHWYPTDLGGCLGGAYFRRKGEVATNPPDARSLRIMRMGKKIEDMVVEDFQNVLKDNPEVMLIDTQTYMVDEELNATARLDLLIVCRSIPTLLYEVKSINSKGFWWMAKEGWKPKPEHEIQIQWYLHKLRDKYPDIEGRILYVSRDDLTIQELAITYNPTIVQQSIDKFKLLNDCWEKNIIPPVAPAVVLNELNGKWQVNYKAKYCSHHALCLSNPEWEKDAELKVARLNAGEIEPNEPEQPTAKYIAKKNPSRKPRKSRNNA